ncbi:MAG: chorismate synthase [Rickettsiales bacterium]|jgi:chorismate synthase|nr:chorismate synthase [Rickettsiales bacterium]
MSGNSFGNILKLTSWGESHGPCIGGVLDGVPPNIKLSEDDIAHHMAKRRPGQNISGTTPRNESDRVEILSGLFDGKTTGTPISFIIGNENSKDRDYSDIKNLFRPGHADYTYFMKYGNRDYRGGGRASARETAVRVAAGAIARKIIPHICIKGALIQIGDLKINEWCEDEIDQNAFFCPDKDLVGRWRILLDKLKNQGDSIGALVEIRARGVDVGLGEPVYNKLNAELARAIMGINAVRSVEIGDGLNVVEMRGSQHCDQMNFKNNRVNFESNHAGGILGGISTGQDIVVRFAIKPTSSIAIEQNTLAQDFKNTRISTTGRHDVCLGIRVVPVGEAMVALVLADYFLLNSAYIAFRAKM